MNLKLQIFLIVMLITVLLILIVMIKNKKLEVKYALSWLLLIFATLILTIFPELIRIMADLIGVGVPVNMLFLAGFCFSLVIIFSLTVASSRMSQRIRKLTQEVALLEKVIKDANIKGEKLNEEQESEIV